MTAARRTVRGVLEDVAELLGLAVSESATLAGLRIDALKKRTQKQLLEVAKKLEVTGVSKLHKDELAARVLEALKALVRTDVFAATTDAVAASVAEVAGASPGVAAGGGGSADRVRSGAKVEARGKNASTASSDGRPSGGQQARGPIEKKNGATSTNGLKKNGVAGSRQALDGATEERTMAHEPTLPETSATAAPLGKGEDAGEEPTGRAKFDLGEAAKGAQRPVENIPWGYGMDRVTAMPVDPERLFVYWEVTDDAIARARASLGPGGAGAWLCLRVYDTTGRLFDGTNANSYFDHNLGRDDRQWFFQIGRPSSTAFVDIGMKSSEGYFARIARSGRVDFPRMQQSHEGDVEWLTVRVATGHVESAGRGAPSLPGAPVPGGGGGDGGGEGASQTRTSFEPLPLWVLRQVPHGGHLEHRLTSWLEREGGGGWQRVEWSEIVGEGWFGVEGRVEWEGPLTVTSWESGPFSYPVEVAEPTREEWQGGSFGFRRDGVMHVVYGPWQVVIRNLGAHYGRTVLSEWEVYRSWVVETGEEVKTLGLPIGAQGTWVSLGASEGMFVGASERRWQVGSELRLAGASERFRVGASEMRLGGASERRMIGASEWTLRGASERRFMGASGFAFGGGSETRLGGASERAFRGASERLGASERMYLGASEGRQGGSEQRLANYSDPSALPVDEVHGRYPKLEG